MCHRHGNHAAGMDTMLHTWGTMLQAWNPCRMHKGLQFRLWNHVIGLDTMLEAWRPRVTRRHDTATKAEVTVQSRDWLGAVIYFGRSHLYPVANFLESKILKKRLIKIGL